MLTDLADLFGTTVLHAPATGFNVHGEPAAYGPAKPYRARVLYRTRMFRDPKGEQAIARGEVWIAGTPAIRLSECLTLPDGTAPRILAVETVSDETGPSYVHVFFG